MVVIRDTQKLLRWLAPAKPVDEPSTTQLGDWYGHLINVGRIRLVLFISERSRLPVVLPGRDLAKVANHLAAGLEQVLVSMQVPTTLVRRELAAMSDVLFAPTNSRSLLETINDFTNLLEWELDQNPRANLLDLSLKMGQTLMRTFGYGNPAEITAELFKT